MSKNGVQDFGVPGKKKMTLKVPLSSNKSDMKQFLKQVYQFDVLKINSVVSEPKLGFSIAAKMKGRKRIVERRPANKKLIVTLADTL